MDGTGGARKGETSPPGKVSLGGKVEMKMKKKKNLPRRIGAVSGGGGGGGRWRQVSSPA
jgi:hypothetical protein